MTKEEILKAQDEAWQRAERGSPEIIKRVEKKRNKMLRDVLEVNDDEN